MTPLLIRLDEAREQAHVLENAILSTREKYATADPQAFSAYIGSLLEELYAVRARIDAELGLDALRTNGASLWVRLRGGRIGEGRAPAQAVGRLIEAIQKGTRQAAAFLELGTAVLHRVPKEIGIEASLDVLAFAPGSARIAVAPSAPQYRVDQPLPLADMALQQLVSVAVWAEGGEADADLDRLLPDPWARRQTLSRIRDIAPSSTRDYTDLQLSGPVVGLAAKRDSVLITPKAYSHASDLLERRQEEPVTFGGRLVAIDVEKTRFHLRHKRARIRCDFPRGLMSAAKGLIGEAVEVNGIGFFHHASELPQRIRVATIRLLTSDEIVRLR